MSESHKVYSCRARCFGSKCCVLFCMLPDLAALSLKGNKVIGALGSKQQGLSIGGESGGNLIQLSVHA